MTSRKWNKICLNCTLIPRLFLQHFKGSWNNFGSNMYLHIVLYAWAYCPSIWLWDSLLAGADIIICWILPLAGEAACLNFLKTVNASDTDVWRKGNIMPCNPPTYITPVTEQGLTLLSRRCLLLRQEHKKQGKYKENAHQGSTDNTGGKCWWELGYFS